MDEARIEELLEQMTLEEQVSLLAGANFWETVPLARLGIPAIRVSDGPNGARGGGTLIGGVSAAAFPVGISLASTWNPALVQRVGNALAEEARSKGASVLLGPTTNIHRSPLNGRNFECYSEDPYLASRLVVGYITGLQERGVAATVKHYVCNDSEYQRMTISSDLDDRTLREIYLPPFEAAVKEANTWAVMSSYNRINGTYVNESIPLQVDILKKEWNWDGLVMSDWFALHSTVAPMNAGLDLEMPGPALYRGQKLLDAINAGEVDREMVRDAVRRLLRLMGRVGAFESPELQPEQAIDKPEHRSLIREAGAEGIVLLKNDGVLPLSPEKLAQVAVIGPNTQTAQIMGGGSAQVNAHYRVSPFQGIRSQLAEQVELSYEQGSTNHMFLPKMEAHVMRTSVDGQPGLKATYYNSPDLSGAPIWETIQTEGEKMWFNEIGPGVDPSNFSVGLEGILIPQQTGRYELSLVSAGLSRMFINDQLLIENWEQRKPGDAFFGTGSAEAIASIDLQADQPYKLRVEYSRNQAVMLAALRIGMFMPLGNDALEKAATLAKQADVAIVYVGTTAEWETEGYDRAGLSLPGNQDELVAAVAAANPRTVVVLQTGGPVLMPWLNDVAAVIQAWMPGQECGNSITDVLTGAVNPSGKLPQTYPLRIEDNPAYLNYPGENGHVTYGERMFVGYRYYEKKDIPVLFPFGYGLSYTSFAYSNARLSASTISPTGTLTAEVDVTNTGKRAGQEIVQLYIRDIKASVSRPDKELKGFVKLALQPGETKTASMTIDMRSLAYYDDLKFAWVAEAGEYEAVIGASSADIQATLSFSLGETVVLPLTQQRRKLTIENQLHELLSDAEAHAVIERHLPGFSAHPQLSMAMSMTLPSIANFVPDQITAAMLQAIAAELEALG